METGLGFYDLDYDKFQMRVSTDRYVSPEFAQRERELVWMKTWQMVGRADELPNAGDFLEHRIYDQSYVIVRGADGQLRAFVNACRHRGNHLCIGRGNCGARIVCQYHIWSYDLDGKLRGVARPDLVGPIDKEELGLLPASVDTFAGFIFLNPDPNAPSLAEFLGPQVMELLSVYRLDELTTVMNVREALDCNWKVVMDAFQEGYHIQGVHPELLRVIVIDPTTTRYNFMGDHRVSCAPFDVAASAEFGPEQQIAGIKELPGTFPGVAEILPRFDELVDEHRDAEGVLHLPEGLTPRLLLQQATREVLTAKGLDVSRLTDAQMSDNHGFLLFPNFFMTVRAGEATVITSMPHPDGDPNRCLWHVTSYYHLPEELREAFKTPLTEVTEPGSYPYFLALQQDYVQMPRQQDGLRNGALEYLALVREELNVALFHQTLDAHMEPKPSA